MKVGDHFNIFEELQAWSKTLENWERLALLKLMQQGGVEEEDEHSIYNEFKLDKRLSKPSEPRQVYKVDESFIPQKPEEEHPLILKELSKVKGVNAIIEGQQLRFGPKLTVIYGPNGSGKSGYARILKAACFTRSKDTTIHGNVHISPESRCEPSASFVFENSSPVTFCKGTPYPQMRDNFAVFDSSCVRVYNDTKTDFTVTPYGFDIFPGLVSVYDRIQELLKDEISRRTPNLEDFKISDSGSSVAVLLNNITADSDLKELERLKEFGAEEENKLQVVSNKIEELNKKDPDELILQKRQHGRDIKIVLNKIRSINEVISFEKSQDIKIRIIALKDLRKIAEASSASQFENEPVQPIGTKTWRKLIEAAIEYNQEVLPGATFPADVAKSRCLLCHQLLDKTAETRLKKFFEFVRSDTEQKIDKAVKDLKTLKKELERINLDFFNDALSGYRVVKECDSTVAEKLTGHINEMKLLREIITSNIESEKWSEISNIESISDDGLMNIRKKLAQELRLLRKKDISKLKKSLSMELQLFNDRKLLNSKFAKVKEVIENLKWIRMAESISKSLKHRHITEKQKALTNELVAKGFIDRFRKECENLDCRLPLNVKISGADAVTHRKLTIGKGDKQMPDPSEVLSEGEQTAVALADFLTEIRLNNRPIGIIFDDPVNSLDHMRKEKIAQRLVKEAFKRQVIIFTHDILFTHHLAEEALKAGPDNVQFMACTVSSNAGRLTPRYINKTVFPHSHYEKESAKQANEYLIQAKQLTGPEQKDKLELGCGALRAAYEDFIQRHLFNDVVARWREPIKATALSRVYFDENTVKGVVDRYELLSRYISGHSQTAEFQDKPLDYNVLEDEIKIFKKITKDYNTAKGKFNEKKSKEKKDVFKS